MKSIGIKIKGTRGKPPKNKPIKVTTKVTTPKLEPTEHYFPKATKVVVLPKEILIKRGR